MLWVLIFSYWNVNSYYLGDVDDSDIRINLFILECKCDSRSCIYVKTFVLIFPDWNVTHWKVRIKCNTGLLGRRGHGLKF